MKKLIYLFFLILTQTISNAQSRDETVTWINAKLTRYGTNIYERHLTLSEDQVSAKYKQFYVSIKGDFLIVKSCNFDPCESPDDVKSNGIFIDNIESVGINSETFHQFKDGRQEKLRIKPISVVVYGSGKKISFVADWDAEPQLLDRMIKAFRHLISLNNQSKPKETF